MIFFKGLLRPFLKKERGGFFASPEILEELVAAGIICDASSAKGVISAAQAKEILSAMKKGEKDYTFLLGHHGKGFCGVFSPQVVVKELVIHSQEVVDDWFVEAHNLYLTSLYWGVGAKDVTFDTCKVIERKKGELPLPPLVVEVKEVVSLNA